MNIHLQLSKIILRVRVRVLRCTALSETRKHIIILQQPYKEDQEETIADLLLFRHHNEETIIRNRDDLYKLWKHRNKLLSQQQ